MAKSKAQLVTSIGEKLVAHYGRPNKFITWWCEPRGLKGSWLTAPWCAMFASYLYSSAGLAKEAGQFAYCPSWVNWLKARKRWGSTPRVGALVFYSWKANGVADHVGIVTAVGSKTIKSLEGNTTKGGAKNWVAVQTRKRDKTILGYGYVDNPVKERLYTVRKGDSLAKIAALYDTTWQKLYAANKAAVGSKPSLIKPGLVLRIP